MAFKAPPQQRDVSASAAVTSNLSISLAWINRSAGTVNQVDANRASNKTPMIPSRRLESNRASMSICTNVQLISMGYHMGRVAKRCHGQGSFSSKVVIRTTWPTHHCTSS